MNLLKMDYQKIDRKISLGMKRWGTLALRISFAVIFVWFGILKPFGLSAAEPLLKATVAWLPFWEPELWLGIIGWWEVVIGITFLFKTTTRIAIGLLLLQMVGTFMPLIFLTDLTFQEANLFLPTMEGQYIIKNLMIISAALVIGGTMHYSKKEKTK